MKRTKRESQSILVHAIFYILLLIGLTYFSYSILYPSITDIEQQKEDTASLLNDMTLIKKNGIPYGDFITLAKTITTGT